MAQSRMSYRPSPMFALAEPEGPCSASPEWLRGAANLRRIAAGRTLRDTPPSFAATMLAEAAAYEAEADRRALLEISGARVDWACPANGCFLKGTALGGTLDESLATADRTLETHMIEKHGGTEEMLNREALHHLHGNG